MKLKFSLVFSVFLSILMLSSCSNNGEYIEHSSGLKYKFIDMNPKGETPRQGDILLLSISYFTEGGLLIDENSSYRTQLATPVYSGDFQTGLGILQVGDSVQFLLDAADYYRNTKKRELPEEFIQGDKIIINVKLKNLVKVESIEAERRAIYHTDEEQELRLMKDYLERANIETEPTESGLYVIILKEGSGPLVLPGQTVSAHYTGTTIDGKIFDSSLTRGTPITFTLGRGEVIKGWDEGFAKLKKGSKARFVIPSKLAYGADGYGKKILPYSTLVFDVELIDFK